MSEEAGSAWFAVLDRDDHVVSEWDMDYKKQLLRGRVPTPDGAPVTMMIVGDDMWSQAIGEKKWTHASRRDTGLDEFTPTGSIRVSRDAAISAVRTGTEDSRGVATDKYVLTVDTAKVVEGQGRDLPARLPPEMEYELWIGPNGLLRKVVMDNGGIYAKALYRWGVEVDDAVAPSPDQVVEAQ